MTNRLNYFAVFVLVPIIPALLLFKALPSAAAIDGPFKGLTIKLGGAFAGYFLVLLLMSQLVPFVDEGPQDYTFRGVVRLGIDSTADPRQWSRLTSVSVKPPRVEIRPNGQLLVHFPFDPESTDPPVILVDAQQCGSALIPIDTGVTKIGAEDYDLNFLAQRHLIVARRPIIIRPPPFKSPAQRDTVLALCGVTPQ